MNKLYLTVLGLVATGMLIWLQAEPTIFSNTNFMQWRSSLIQGTGIIALLLLTLTMLLALRLPWIEKLTAGLDKSYRLHKWVAIWGVILGAAHWLLAIVPKKLVQLGLLERGNHARPELDPDSLQATVTGLRGGAESIGEIALYGFILLTLIALFAPIKYKHFKLTHKAMAAAFIVIAYHSVVLLKPSYWDNLITPMVIAFALIGTACAVVSLLGLIGKRRTHQGVISALTYNPENQTTKVAIALPTWSGHHAGQFAFLKVAGEEPHPFTISSSADAPQLEFTIKALGDFTATLHQRLTVGEKVAVEGPYGKFQFEDNRAQIWIAGGIGIAAFKARLTELKQQENAPSVTLYYCTQAPSSGFIHELETLAREANIEFHVIDNRVMQHLTIADIKQKQGRLDNHSVWFCGPLGFGEALKSQLSNEEFDLKHFHTELFNFR
ncbi:ferric reductase-like transmembrane domain-containing protein [Vibrio scophthalmi]|uniref:ferredoxin reductase family protein n=1 Tax=Vibrio scophthalmi TaxID=45658 RepID=UPI002283EA88|nr:ferric reductase-like transmembrane domain-containing protein [Vibrio scophthalmi]MCY9802356.1 ferric reductase-like transmembrane domain-containing protein [Vibrio scophthalmi]